MICAGSPCACASPWRGPRLTAVHLAAMRRVETSPLPARSIGLWLGRGSPLKMTPRQLWGAPRSARCRGPESAGGRRSPCCLTQAPSSRRSHCTVPPRTFRHRSLSLSSQPPGGACAIIPILHLWGKSPRRPGDLPTISQGIREGPGSPWVSESSDLLGARLSEGAQDKCLP